MPFSPIIDNSIFSILYSAFSIPIIILSIITLSYLETHFKLHSVFGRIGDIEIFIIITIFSIAIFWLANFLLNYNKKNFIPKNHFHQCFVPYILLLLTLFTLIIGYSESNGSLGYAVFIMFFLIMLYAIIINLFYLLYKKIREGLSKR